MPSPRPVQGAFNHMVRDVSRDALPPGACWNMQDLIPGEMGAPAAERGGWTYASQALTSLLASSVNVPLVFHCPFSAGHQLVAVAHTAANVYKLGQIVSTSSTTDRGTVNCTNNPFLYPVFYRDKLYILNSTTPQTYDGSSNVANLTGSPPDGDFGCVYKDKLVIARTGSFKTSVYLSATGDPTSWDTTNRVVTASAEVTGLWPLRNQIIVFHHASVERIIGTLPPPGGDMQVQPVFDVGVPRDAGQLSVAGTDQFVCFANLTGAYLTDGSQPVDLTQQAGIKKFWADRISTAAVPRISGGYFRGWYVVSISDNFSTFVDCFAFYLPSRRAIRLTNITAMSFGRRVGAASEELFWGDYSEARVNTFMSIFDHAAANKADGDGTAVASTLELPFYWAGLTLSTVKNVFFAYDLRDAASDNPTAALSYVTTPEETSYTTVTGADALSYPLRETTKMTRVKRPIRKQAHGVGLKVARSGASAGFRLHRVDLDQVGREPARV